jgi:probable phosphoglycerate mutase
LRHGQSLANTAGIISSDPTISIAQHGLSEEGVAQAKSASETFSASAQGKRVAIFSSDFKRARETAEIFAERLASDEVELFGDVQLEPRLRERWFGDFNGLCDSNYQLVWDEDIKTAEHQAFNVESLESVVSRTTELVVSLDTTILAQDAEGQPWHVLLVAHGDVLQILQTAFAKVDVCAHRSLPHLETATVRELAIGNQPVSDEIQAVYGEYLEYYNNQKDKGWKS